MYQGRTKRRSRVSRRPALKKSALIDTFCFIYSCFHPRSSSLSHEGARVGALCLLRVHSVAGPPPALHHPVAPLPWCRSNVPCTAGHGSPGIETHPTVPLVLSSKPSFLGSAGLPGWHFRHGYPGRGSLLSSAPTRDKTMSSWHTTKRLNPG